MRNPDPASQVNLPQPSHPHRVFERGETRHYDFVRERISLVVDLYDAEKYEGSRNYYTPNRPLSAENRIGPRMP